MKDGLAGIHFDEIYCSPLSRCVRLAEYCALSQPKVHDKKTCGNEFRRMVDDAISDKITDLRLQEMVCRLYERGSYRRSSSIQQRHRLECFLNLTT